LKSALTDKFRKTFDKLPKEIQDKARQAYKIWKEDNNYPSLHYKQVHKSRPIYSVRIGLSYRALGVIEGDTIIWFWIGSHEDYNHLLGQL
jgi:mRNA-degrading endonuclease RelE of RelBE toxin-antitoxin system